MSLGYGNETVVVRCGAVRCGAAAWWGRRVVSQSVSCSRSLPRSGPAGLVRVRSLSLSDDRVAWQQRMAPATQSCSACERYSRGRSKIQDSQLGVRGSWGKGSGKVKIAFNPQRLRSWAGQSWGPGDGKLGARRRHGCASGPGPAMDGGERLTASNSHGTIVEPPSAQTGQYDDGLDFGAPGGPSACPDLLSRGSAATVKAHIRAPPRSHDA